MARIVRDRTEAPGFPRAASPNSPHRAASIPKFQASGSGVLTPTRAFTARSSSMAGDVPDEGRKHALAGVAGGAQSHFDQQLFPALMQPGQL
jgi:hypothetical protein